MFTIYAPKSVDYGVYEASEFHVYKTDSLSDVINYPSVPEVIEDPDDYMTVEIQHERATVGFYTPDGEYINIPVNSFYPA